MEDMKIDRVYAGKIKEPEDFKKRMEKALERKLFIRNENDYITLYEKKKPIKQ